MGGRAGRGARARHRRLAAAPELSDRVAAFVQWAAVPAVAVLALVMTLPRLGPAYAVRAGHGVTGTFYARERRCFERARGGPACHQLWGEFVPDDGTGESYVRHVEPPKGFGVGGNVPAVQPDRSRARVYRATGSRDWLVTTATAAASVVALVVWALLRSRRGRRQQRA
jgi:hypothetical protein